MTYSHVCVIGLDCAPPELVFDRWGAELPYLRRLRETGVWGALESVIPPITVPAWMCMMTGKDPGTLGIYGFRNRKDYSYEGLCFANSRMIREEAVWDVLAKHGKRSVLLGLPLTYPPRPIHGLMICDFLAPDTSVEYTYPPELKTEIQSAVGDYIIDVRDFRTNDKDRLLTDIYTMTQRRFKLARHLLTHHPWDLFVMVEMGTDRIHHGFWRYFDSEHPLYSAGNPYENAIRDYYLAVDREIGETLAVLPDDTLVLVVSDHGAKRMDGGICFNEWLMQEGYLVLKDPVKGVTKFSPALVDWSRTKAWGDGGYYGRLFLNVKGREPNGIVAPEEYETLRSELMAKLESLGDEQGRPIGTKVYRPQDVYRATAGIPPDLIVYFGDLNWRSVGSLGNGTIWTHENDTGPDDANHAQYGIAILSALSDEPAAPYAIPANRRDGMSLYDIAPTILRAFGIEPPEGMGRCAIALADADSVYTKEEEAEIARRLEDLGYL
jgi:predicted AlkP superfamily phosphohydrolase/phosphomutase